MPVSGNEAYNSVKDNPTVEDIRDFCISPIEQKDDFPFVRFDTTSPELYMPRPAREQLLDLHYSLCEAARETMAKKNKDYATDQDVFRNFRMFGGLGILVRASDKLARLRTFEERNEFSVSDESLRDTIEDLINYAVIYLAYKQEGK